MSKPMIIGMMEKCHIIDKVTSDDAYGGAVISYRVGASIDAAIIKNSTTEAIVAEKQTGTGIYTVIVKKGFVLDYHDVIQRDSDGAFFLLTSGTTDSEAPDKSTIPIAKATAEPWKIPDGVIVQDAPSTGTT